MEAEKSDLELGEGSWGGGSSFGEKKKKRIITLGVPVMAQRK